MFFNNGMYVKDVRYDGELHILLNDSFKEKDLQLYGCKG